MRSLILSALIFPCVASAVPLELSHQGRLFDQLGTALDGPHDLDVLLYDTASGGTPVWQDSYSGLAFDAGYFTVMLGQGAPLDAASFDDDNLWLALAVDGGAEIPTRLKLASVPYAIRARTANDIAPGAVINASEIQINGTTVIDSSGNLSAPPPDSDTLAGITGCAADDILTWTGSQWDCGTVSVPSTFDASAVTSGTMDVNRLPVGNTSSHVAPGDHVHDLASLTGTLPTGALPPGVLLGDPGDTCGAAEEGTVRFANDVFEGCTSGGWVELGAWRPNDGSDATSPGVDCDSIHGLYPALGNGLYWIDPDGVGGNAPLQVACDMVTEGGGWIDLVASFNSTLDGDQLLADFFLTNGLLGTTISWGTGAETSTGNPGFWIDNSGYSASHARGFHFKPDLTPYTQVRVDYHMQGAQNDSNRCTSGSWIPLNGPGYNGNCGASYQSQCVSGYSCIQGACTNNRDLPIQATYSNDVIDSSDTLLTWSQSVSTPLSDSCAKDPEIPHDHPTTYFTELRFK